MNRTRKLLVIALVTLLAVVLLTARRGSNLTDDLVGTWVFDQNPYWTYTFHAHGTGTRGGGSTEMMDFNWSVDRGVLLIECSVGFFDDLIYEYWNVTIDGNVLTLDLSHENPAWVFTYTRR